MTRDELIGARKALFKRISLLRSLGDHSAEAPDVRANAEDILRLYDHLLETTKDDPDAA